MDERGVDQSADASDVAEPAPLHYLSPWQPLRPLSLEGAAVLVCRGLALWAWIQVLQSLSYSVIMSIFAMVEAPISSFRFSFASQLLFLPGLLVYGTAGVVLWFKANWLSERITRIIPTDPSPATPAPAVPEATTVRRPVDDAAPLLGILVIVSGVFILGESIPEFARAISTSMTMRRTDDASGWLTGVISSADFWPAVVKCAIGAWVMIGSRGIARLVLKLRKSDPKPDVALAESADMPDGPL